MQFLTSTNTPSQHHPLLLPHHHPPPISFLRPPSFLSSLSLPFKRNLISQRHRPPLHSSLPPSHPRAQRDTAGPSSLDHGLDLADRDLDNGGAAQAPLERLHNRRPKPGQHGSPDSRRPFKLSSILLSTVPIIYPSLAENASYSQASYYTSLGLFLLSLPGLWSLIKRSAKSKIVQKTFTVPGPSAEKGKAPSQVAGEITSFFTRNNFEITDRGETVTFEGQMTPSRGQAAFLTFCTCISLASVALVLTITLPDAGDKWYWLTALSPLAGVYYWTRASRKEQIKVKMVMADDETATDVIVQGDDEQIDRLRREFDFMEKGMVYVKGIFEKLDVK